MYLEHHSYQSYLWNKVVEKYLSDKPNLKNIDIPILGFDTDFSNKDIKKIYDKFMKEEDISERDFIIRAIPQLSMEGSKRKLFLKFNDFKYSKLETDELNKTKNKIIFEFKLGKGCYATIFIKYLMSS